MIPFEDLVASLERYKLRRQAAAANAPAGKPVSGKPAQGAAAQQFQLNAEELLHEE
jgi:hypothetical protein